jgi:predicted ATPase
MQNTSKKLSSISIKGFKSIKSIENLEVRSINILIGANGVGKSNFIDVFDLIDLIREAG